MGSVLPDFLFVAVVVSVFMLRCVYACFLVAFCLAQKRWAAKSPPTLTHTFACLCHVLRSYNGIDKQAFVFYDRPIRT